MPLFLLLCSVAPSVILNIQWAIVWAAFRDVLTPSINLVWKNGYWHAPTVHCVELKSEFQLGMCNNHWRGNELLFSLSDRLL
jgi:hypothetical protein